MSIQSMQSTQANPGSITDVKVYRKGRRCKLCRKLLNSYTPGPYCLSHQFKGAVMDVEMEEARREKKWARYRKKMAKRAKERRASK